MQDIPQEAATLILKMLDEIFTSPNATEKGLLIAAGG
jgi:hypothetical protein